MLVEDSDKQWKMWDDMARNEGREKAGIKQEKRESQTFFLGSHISSDGVKLPLQCGETRWAEPVQQHAPPVSSIVASAVAFLLLL